MVPNGSIESIEKSVLSSEASFEAYDNTNAPYGDYSRTQGYNDILTPYPNQKPDPQPRSKIYGLPEYTSSNAFELAYRNEGFKDNSVYSGTRNNSVGTMLNDDSTPIIHQTDQEEAGSDYYGNSSTLPIRSNGGESLTFLSELKQRLPEYESLPRPTHSGHSSFLPPPPDPPTPTASDFSYHSTHSVAPIIHPKPKHDVKKNKYAIPEIRRPIVEPPPPVNRPESYYKATRGLRDSTNPPKAAAVVHNNNRPKTLYEASDEQPKSPTSQNNRNQPPTKSNYSRSKSEALLETNFDDGQSSPTMQPLSPDNRSYSQPLETAM